MKIKIPALKESQKKRKKLRNFSAGLTTGIIVFGLIVSPGFWRGIDKVETYTWIALGFGALSFGFLSMWFGNDFWRRLIGYE